MIVFLLTGITQFLWAQESIHRPIEIGLMAKNFSWGTEVDNEVFGQELQAWQVTLAPFLQISGLNRHFLRVSAGLSVGQSESTQIRGGGNLLLGRTGKSHTTWLETSALYGKEVNPFDGPFSKRFGFRFGAGLMHRFKLEEQFVSEFTRIDTVQGNVRVETTTNSNRGSQQLAILGSAQLNFNPINGLSLGIEWQMAAGLDFGAQHSHSTRTLTTGGVVTTTIDRGSTYPFQIGREFFLSSYPFLMIGWRF